MDELNRLRNQAKNRLLACIGTLLGAGIVAAIILRYDTGSFLPAFFFLPFLVIVGVLLVTLLMRKPRRAYRKAYKQVLVRGALESVFTELEYEPELGISYDTIASTKMMNMGDRFHSEDYVSGMYRNIFFEQSDVHIQEEHQSTDSNGHTTTSYVTIFRGRWMIFEFNKEFRANLQIAQKGFPNARRKRFFGKKETRFKQVEMESDSFNKGFYVFAQNEHDAFYIITPAFMERIQNLAAHNRGKLLFCFVGDRLHIAIHDNRDSFEPGSLFRAIDEAAAAERIRGEILTITQFIDELNLDNSLFKY